MATETYFFNGKCKWAKVYKPDTKYEPQYNIQLYLDKENEGILKESGLGLKVKEDEDGRYVGFRRKVAGPEWRPDMGPPKVIDAGGGDFSDLIGNGSDVTLKVEVFDTPRTGGKGHRLETVRVDKHVKYEAPREEGTPEPQQETKKPKGMPF